MKAKDYKDYYINIIVTSVHAQVHYYVNKHSESHFSIIIFISFQQKNLNTAACMIQSISLEKVLYIYIYILHSFPLI